MKKRGYVARELRRCRLSIDVLFSELADPGLLYPFSPIELLCADLPGSISVCLAPADHRTGTLPRFSSANSFNFPSCSSGCPAALHSLHIIPQAQPPTFPFLLLTRSRFARRAFQRPDGYVPGHVTSSLAYIHGPL